MTCLVGADEEGAGVRVEEEGGGGLGVLLLEPVAALQTHVVSNVPYPQLLRGEEQWAGLTKTT